jgi:hypothetical protein
MLWILCIVVDKGVRGEGRQAVAHAPVSNISKILLVLLSRRVICTRLQKMVMIKGEWRVLWLAKFESVPQVRNEYHHVFNEEPPYENSICCWDRQLKEMGSLLDQQHSGRPSLSDESVENI